MPEIDRLRPGVNRLSGRTWANRHETVKQRITGIYDVFNVDSDNKLEAYNTSTQALSWLIEQSLQNNSQLHALGGGWSLTNVGMTNGYLVNTKPLRLRFSIKKDSITGNYPGKANHLFFVQCGNSITRLNRFLRARKKSLKTSGSSNGQTIVGAFATGSHGSTFDFGSIQDYVVGLHLIVDSDRHIWLERASYPVTQPGFAANLGAELVRDDQLFNAALVSFGSFGLIHGVLIEAEARFLLEAHRVWLPYDAELKKTISTLKFSGLTLPDRKRPFHFEVIFSPNDPTRRAYINVMYKRPFRHDYPHPEPETDEIGLGDGALTVFGRILDGLPSRLTRKGLQKSVEEEYAEYGPKWGTLGEIFSSETVRGKTLSAAMAVPLEFAEKALEAAFTAHSALSADNQLFAGLISLRYVKGSRALLAFTRYENSAVLEIDGLYNDGGLNYLKMVWKQLDSEKIPYTTHWGKLNNITASRIRKAYTDEVVEQWIGARKKLLSPEVRKIFSNPFLKQAGLDS